MNRGECKRWASVACMAACLAVLHAAPVSAATRDGKDRVALGETITVDQGQTAGDLVCAFCTVHLRGDVSGDVVTFFGTTDVGEGREISGDMVIVGGGLKLGEGSKLDGDLVLFGGSLERAETAVIRGDRAVMAGSGWLLLLLLPALVPIGIVWFVVSLLRRARYRFPAYPGGRF